MTRKRNQEVEVKFTCDAVTLQRVLKAEALQAPHSHHVKALNATYYDTANFRLRKAGSVLRMRTSDGKEPVLCFKSLPSSKSGAFHRMECEVPSPQGLVDPALFDASTAKLLLRMSGDKPLQAQFVVDVRREIFLVSRGGATIEISADEGEVRSGEKSAALVELELELKSGEEAGLYDLAAELAHQFPLSLSFRTKSERGYRLIGKPRAIATKFPNLRLSKNMPMDDLIQTSLSHAVFQVAANWDGLIDGHSAEAVHQMRIALRRFRTFLWVFSQTNPCAEFRVLTKEARILARVLGKARSLDVLAQTLRKSDVASNISKREMKSLLTVIADRREEASWEAIALFKGKTAAQFVLHAQSLIAGKKWNKPKSKTHVSARHFTTEKFVRVALDRQYARVRRRGRQFGTLSTEKLHAVRLSLKALSSTSSAFVYLTRRRKNAPDFEATMVQLQQGLGQLNDIVFAQQFFEAFADGQDGAVKKASKKIARRFKRKLASLQSKLQGRWKAFKKIKPYWD